MLVINAKEAPSFRAYLSTISQNSKKDYTALMF